MKNSTLFKKWLLLIAFGVFGFSYSSAAIQADTTVLLSETFATTLGSFTTQSLLGDQVWAWNASAYAKMTGFTTVNNANEDWLISPSIDLTGASSIYLSFFHAHKYGKDTINNLQLMVTDAYTTGVVDPGDWTPILFPLSTQATWTFVNSGYLSLEAYKGKKNVHFAFRYRSNTTASATWEVKNVTLKAIVPPVVQESVMFSENFDKVTTNTTAVPGTTDISTTFDTYTTAPGWTGAKVYQAGGGLKMGSSSVAGVITTPAIDLSAQSGTFKISFKSLTWSGDTTHLQIYVNDVLAKEITGLNNDASYTYGVFGPYELTGGTAATKIKFTTSKAVAKNCRFYLDSLVIIQGAAATPSATVSTQAFKTQPGTPLTQNLTVLGKNLTGDLTVSLTNKVRPNFSTTVSTISKADALAGFNLGVQYLPTAAGVDTATITLSGGGLASPVNVAVIGSAFTPIVANLAALRAAYVANPDPTAVYTVTGPIVASYINTTTTTSTSRSVYFQDETGGVLSYESKAALANIITPEYAVGSAVSGYSGTLTEYGKLLEFVPTVAPAASSTGNALIPVELTIAQAKSMKEKYESMVVCVKGLSKCVSNTATVWAVAKANYNFGIGSDSIVLRTNYTLMDYMDGATAISSDPTNYAGLLIEYNGAIQIVPRTKTDLGYTGPTSNLRQVNSVATVWGSNGVLNINAKEGQTIEVYNLMGKRLMKSTTHEGINTFSMSKNQLYLVRLNNRVTKIVL